MPLQIAIPDDYTGATDDIKVRAAIADNANKEIGFDRMYSLADPTAITVRSGLTLRGRGKQGGAGITKTGGGGHLFAGSDLAGFRIAGLDLYGADDAAFPQDRMFSGMTVKQCSMENCLVWGFTGDAWFVDGADSNDNFTRDNRIVGGSSANSSACGLYYSQGNACYSQGDYVSMYPTLIRVRVTGFSVRDARLEAATAAGGDAVYIEGGTCAVRDSWFDANTIRRTIVQTGSYPVWAGFNRGAYSSNVHMADSSKFWAEWNPA